MTDEVTGYEPRINSHEFYYNSSGIFQRLDQTQRAFEHQNFGLIDVF